MRASFKIFGAAFASVAIGLLLNMSAAEINPAYAPQDVRLGWFIVVFLFAVYVVHLFTAGWGTLYASWLRMKNRLWVAVGAITLAGVFLFGAYRGVNSL